jgi:hypothetical protein
MGFMRCLARMREKTRATVLLLGLAAASAAAAPNPVAAPAAKPAGSAGYQRVALGPPDKPFPYTVEIPAGWQVRHDKDLPGIFLAPPDAVLSQDPRVVYVRVSRSSLADAAKTVASIQASDAKDPAWSAPEVAVRRVDGVPGVLVRMDREGKIPRSTLVLKLPLTPLSVDFTASAPRSEFDRLRPTWERMLFSVKRTEKSMAQEAPKDPAKKP